MVRIASRLNFGCWKLGSAKNAASFTAVKSRIPQRTAATYPAMMAIRIGITDKNPRNRICPKTATPSVTRNTITFFISISIVQKSCCTCSTSGKFQTDQCNYRSHCSSRKYNIDPFGSTFSNDQCQNHTCNTENYKTAQCILISEFTVITRIPGRQKSKA